MLEVGDRIDVWVVTQRLGHGGMGSVYRCHNVDATRIEAAIKVLADSVTSSEEGRRRFVREAEILYRVQHPNVVAVRNIRMDAHPPFIEMEFVDGRALHEVIDEGPQSEADVRSWMRQLAEALEHLHGLGIRHRDIKPANLLLTSDGLLKLVDFGLALETDEDRLTREGMTFGTVSYAPPEWMDPASLDPVQWDLYALGVVFYELLTGSFAYPLSGEGPLRKQLLQVALAKQNSPPLDPGEGVSEGTRTLVRRLTTREPDDRPASATEVLELLTASEEGRLRDLPPPVAVLSEAEAPPAPPPPIDSPTAVAASHGDRCRRAVHGRGGALRRPATALGTHRGAAAGTGGLEGARAADGRGARRHGDAGGARRRRARRAPRGARDPARGGRADGAVVGGPM